METETLLPADVSTMTIPDDVMREMDEPLEMTRARETLVALQSHVRNLTERVEAAIERGDESEAEAAKVALAQTQKRAADAKARLLELRLPHLRSRLEFVDSRKRMLEADFEQSRTEFKKLGGIYG